MIRRLPLPPTEPPYDDERRTPPPPQTQGTLALVFGLPSGVPASPQPPARLRLVTELDRTLPSRPGQLPDSRRWTAQLAQALSELLCGQRPIQQFLRWTTEEVYAALAARVGRVNRKPSAVRMSGLRPHVRALRVCEPRDGVVEASVVIEQAGRCRAIALRLEGQDGRWQCTRLDLI